MARDAKMGGGNGQGIVSRIHAEQLFDKYVGRLCQALLLESRAFCRRDTKVKR
jgi:hypothetical protein